MNPTCDIPPFKNHHIRLFSKYVTKHLINWGGSTAWKGDGKEWNLKEMKFYYYEQGFILVQLDDSNANFVYYNIFGQVLHQFMVSKEFHSAKCKNIPHNKTQV